MHLRHIIPRPLALSVVALCALAGTARSQESTSAPTALAPPGHIAWSGRLDAYLYIQEGGPRLMPILRGDRGPLHVEGRYEYEDARTGSAWVGWTLGAGKDLHLDIVPMAGLVLGRTDAWAPGLEATLSWRDIALYCESEQVLDFDPDGDFFYTWSELTWQARPSLRFGLSVQYSRFEGGETQTDPGLLVALRRGPVELIAYGFDLDDDSRYAILTLSIIFPR